MAGWEDTNCTDFHERNGELRVVDFGFGISGGPAGPGGRSTTSRCGLGCLRGELRHTWDMPSSLVKRVIVLGGGSAGFIAAVTLTRRLPQLEMTVLRSPDIGVIGVGLRTKVEDRRGKMEDRDERRWRMEEGRLKIGAAVS